MQKCGKWKDLQLFGAISCKILTLPCARLWLMLTLKNRLFVTWYSLEFLSTIFLNIIIYSTSQLMSNLFSYPLGQTVSNLSLKLPYWFTVKLGYSTNLVGQFTIPLYPAIFSRFYQLPYKLSFSIPHHD